MFLSMLEDEQEKEIFVARYEQHQYDCLHMALRMLKNHAQAEDAVHDAFLVVITQKEKYLTLSNLDFRRALTVIVKNKCYDVMRREKKLVDFPLSDLENSMESGDAPLEEHIVLAMDVQHMKTCLIAIDKASSQILEMRYIQGLSYKEISETLEIGIKNVEVRIARAKQKVRDLMRKDEKNVQRVN